MLKQKYTTVTQLHEINNKNIIEYFENACVCFCKLQRKAFHIFKNENIKGSKIDYNFLLKKFMVDYKISRRTANSILKDVQGKMKAFKELKKYEVSQKEQKIKNLKEEIEELDSKILEFQEKMKNKIKVNHLKYWNLKKSRTFKKMKLNKFQMRLEQLKWQMFLTRKTYGTIGVDFNKGFLTVSETDRSGNLVKNDILKYRFRKGNKTQSDLENCISKILKKASETGKDVCFEDLNFKGTKSKTSKGKTDKDKKYNNMLHSLAYSLYDKLMTNMAFRNKVGIIKVNPAWTSWIAKNKFCKRMKLNIHIGASLVIARRGLGIKDTIK